MRRFASALFALLLFSAGNSVLAQPDFTANVTEGCTPLRVKFTIDPSTIDYDTVTSINWDFGNGDTSDEIAPDTIYYIDQGVYSVNLYVNGDQANPISKDSFIVVHRTVNAAFNYEQYEQNYNYRFIPVDRLTSDDATYSFTWEYFDMTGSDDRVNIETGINYLNQARAVDSVSLDTGIYRVQLTVVDQINGCISQSLRQVIVADKVILPNVFVYGEGRFFIIDPQDPNIVLNFQVFNRNGLKVFEQTSPIINWNGETSWGRQLTTGVYFYVIEPIEGDPLERYKQHGFIHLYPAQ